MRKLLFLSILSLALTGCIKEGEQSSFDERFSMKSHGQDFNAAIFVITDTQTGQEYLLVKSGYGCAMSPIQTQK